MKKDDLDKLKLLANNNEEYLNALMVKLRNNAIDNGHDMSQFTDDDDSTYSWQRPGWGKSYRTYCTKCIFEIKVDRMDEEISFDTIKANTKCNR